MIENMQRIWESPKIIKVVRLGEGETARVLLPCKFDGGGDGPGMENTGCYYKPLLCVQCNATAGS